MLLLKVKCTALSPSTHCPYLKKEKKSKRDKTAGSKNSVCYLSSSPEVRQKIIIISFLKRIRIIKRIPGL